MDKNGYTLAIIAAIIGNSIFGFSFLFSKIALSKVSPIVLLAARFDLAFLTMLILVLFKVIKLEYKGKNVKFLILLGILQPVFYFLCENNGLNYISSSISGVIIALIPVISFFTGSIFLKEHFKMNQLLWAIISVIGVIILSISGSKDASFKWIGLILLFGAVISAAFYNTISRKISDEFSPFERTFMMFLIGALTFTTMALIQTKGECIATLMDASSDLSFDFTIAYLAIFSSIGAFSLLNYSISYLPLRQATSFASLTSIISVLAGVIVLHEHISMIQYVGIVLILFGVYKVNTAKEM